MAQDIVQAMTNPNLEEVAANAQELVNEKFSYDSSSRRFAEILKDKLSRLVTGAKIAYLESTDNH